MPNKELEAKLDEAARKVAIAAEKHYEAVVEFHEVVKELIKEDKDA